MTKRARIEGLGIAVPDTIRTNDWWSQDIIAKWQAKALEKAMRGADAPGDPDTNGARRVKEAMAETQHLPFAGTRERRILTNDKTSLDLELLAAKDAMQRAGVSANDLDFLLIQSAVPEFLHIGNGPALHEALGLRPDCRCHYVEGVCNSFQQHLEIASMLIETNRHRRGLMVQSSLFPRLIPAEDPASLLFGDGAMAQVVGGVDAPYGLLGTAHFTDGSVYGGAVTGAPGKRWYEGASTMHIHDARRGRQMFLSSYDVAADVIARALAAAGVEPKDVAFYAGHQATIWFQRVTQEAGGLAHARRVDTFAAFGSLSGANLPFSLAIAEREGVLRKDDLVVLFAGASGQTASASVLRWGHAH